jgi:quercetin dioxygenase-like cupin family protein
LRVDQPSARVGRVEIAPGVFVSSLSTGEGWEPDPDVGGEMHELHHEGVWAGLTRFTDAGDEVVKWTLEERETALVLEGAATIEIEGGPTLEVKEGDLFSIPEGASTTWHLTKPFREFWVLG